MLMFKKDLIGLSVAILAALVQGCAGAPQASSSLDQQQVVAQNQEAVEKVGFRCERVKTTGSNLASKRCTTRKQREQEQQDAQGYVDDVNRNGTLIDIERR